jgi:hypothetical protein
VLQYGLNQRNSPAARRVNFHEIQDVVNLDDIIEYAANTHTLDSGYTSRDNGTTTGGNGTLIAHMAGRS